MSQSSTSTVRVDPPAPPGSNGPKMPAERRDANDHDHDDEGHDRKPPPDDVRYYLPQWIRRFSGYRTPGKKPPYDPVPFPPFSWVKHVSLTVETWIWGFFGSLIGIGLIEIVMITRFHDTPGNGIIVAAFGAGAVLVYSQFESPLAQPRSIIGGNAISCVISVGLTRLFRLAGAARYGNVANMDGGELGHIGWVCGALAMSLALLAMQITGTTHPPGGAAALIGATQQGAITSSWRFIYIVMVSACLELGWALLWNNLGRRRYPTYWISPDSHFGNRLFQRLRRAPAGSPREADERVRSEKSKKQGDESGGDGGQVASVRGLINTEQRLGQGEGAGLQPDKERRLKEEGIFRKA